ncbi:MAG TPA: hypothetical protein VF812_03670 [Ktedonobacterales bacterium]
MGIVRVFYTRANEPGRIVLMIEAASVEEAQDALAALLFQRAQLMDFALIPLESFTDLSRLFAAA